MKHSFKRFVLSALAITMLFACVPVPASPAPAAPQVIEVEVTREVLVTVEIPVTAVAAIPAEEDLLEETFQEAIPTPTVEDIVKKEQLTRQGAQCYSTYEIEQAFYTALDGSPAKWRNGTSPAVLSVTKVETALSAATCTYALNLDDLWVPGENTLRFSSEDISFVENLVTGVFPQDIVEIRLFMWNIHNGKPKKFVDQRSFYERMPTGGFLIYLTQVNK